MLKMQNQPNSTKLHLQSRLTYRVGSSLILTRTCTFYLLFHMYMPKSNRNDWILLIMENQPSSAIILQSGLSYIIGLVDPNFTHSTHLTWDHKQSSNNKEVICTNFGPCHNTVYLAILHIYNKSKVIRMIII